jgi:hypothetical protein
VQHPEIWQGITLPVAAKLCNFYPAEIMDLEPLFIMADEKR